MYESNEKNVYLRRLLQCQQEKKRIQGYDLGPLLHLLNIDRTFFPSEKP